MSETSETTLMTCNQSVTDTILATPHELPDDRKHKDICEIPRIQAISSFCNKTDTRSQSTGRRINHDNDHPNSRAGGGG